MAERRDPGRRSPGHDRAPRRDRRFALALTVAFLLHLPFTPIPAFVSLRDALFGHLEDYDEPDAQAVVPIDLDVLARDPEPSPPAAPPPAPSSPPPPPPAPEEKHSDAPAPKPHPAAPPDAPDGGPARERHEEARKLLVDPTNEAGGAGKVAAKDPNIQVLISGNVLRKHPIGAWASRMLVRIPEWRGFFEGTPLDPIRDFNHVLITAPRLWSDSSKMVAILDYNVSPDLARDAVDRVLRNTNGVWLEDAPVSTARAKIGGVSRLVAHLPEKKLLVILPADASDQLAQLKKARGFRDSKEAVVVSMVNPWRPFRAFAHVPESLKWLRLAVTPAADGGLEVAVDIGDASHDEAVAHAAELTREIEDRRARMSVEIFEPLTLAAEGDVIRGTTRISGLRLAALLMFAEGLAPGRPPP